MQCGACCPRLPFSGTRCPNVYALLSYSTRKNASFLFPVKRLLTVRRGASYVRLLPLRLKRYYSATCTWRTHNFLSFLCHCLLCVRLFFSLTLGHRALRPRLATGLPLSPAAVVSFFRVHPGVEASLTSYLSFSLHPFFSSLFFQFRG